jgi:phosphonate transport system ATP-binding protein
MEGGCPHQIVEGEIMTPVLMVENITKEYPNGVQALKGISFDVYSGDFIAIIGPSGSGKSTALRCINKLVEPTDGRIVVGTSDTGRLSSKALRSVRRKIGMIFQHYNLVSRLSVLQNVMHGRLGYMSTLDGALWQVYRERQADRRGAAGTHWPGAIYVQQDQ